MNTIIKNISYPIFTPNQVLTKDDLNQVVNYLDGQNRLTRAYLIGTGIVWGMDLSSTFDTTKAQIQISAGCGITSEGYLISVPTTILTHYKNDQLDSEALFAPTPQDDEVTTTQLKSVPVIELFQKSADNLFALNQADNGNPPDKAAFETFLSKNVLVVVYEIQDVETDYCLLDFDRLSNQRNFNLRFFLLPRSQPENQPNIISADRLLKRGYPFDKLPEPWANIAKSGTSKVFETSNHFLQEFDSEIQAFKDYAPKVQRFGYVAEKKVDLSKISNYADFWHNYYLVCKNAIAAIEKAFPKLFQLFSPFFSSFQPASYKDFEQIGQSLQKLLNSIQNPTVSTTTVEVPEAPYTLQYFYDYLSQIVAAYDELAEAAFDLMDDCAPDTRRFPKFLLLGIIPPPKQTDAVERILPPEQADPVIAPPSPYRSNFTQPPINNAEQSRVKQVRYLYQRLLNLCRPDSYYLLPYYNTPIKITPSKDRSVTLSQQAIPYYFNYPNLYQYWSYDAYRKSRSEQIPAYFCPQNSSPRDELLYRLDGYNFYRIEGHIGKSTSKALNIIQQYQQQYNLPFDVIILKCSSFQSFQDLNISGQIDDLEVKFQRVKDWFNSLWEANSDWSQNVFLNTLKRAFFDKPRLSAIADTQLVNPIVELAQSKSNYEFVPEANTSNQYQLFLKNNVGTRIARYDFQNAANQSISLDFSGLTNEQITQEQQRIVQDLSFYLKSTTITYSLVRQSPSNSLSYYLRLSIIDELDLPINATTTAPRGKAKIAIISLNYFTIRLENNLPIINQSEFQDFATLYGLLRDVPEGDSIAGDRAAADLLNNVELQDLIESYRERLKQLMELQLFHKFAQQHPGMEHLGGVPKGGTFVLVYVDGEEVKELLAANQNPAIYQLQTLRTAAITKNAVLPPAAPEEIIPSWELLFKEYQERKDIVVADFCLPYRCSSDTAGVSYILARPRPIVLLTQTEFCEGDTTEYEFILEPEGGTLKGEGIFFKGRKHYFKPSNITQEIDAEVAITFTYAVDDSFDTLTVTIYPLPDAGFQVGINANQTTFCADNEPLSLTPKQAGGNFRVLVGEQDISADVLDTTSQPPRLLVSAVQLGNAEQLQVTIEYTITSPQNCTNQAKKQITIFALPDARFQIGEQSNRNRFATNDPPVLLVPRQPGGSFRVLVGDHNISAEVLNIASQPPEFLPSRVDLGDAGQLQVTIEYTITNNHACTNQTQQQVTIFAPPDADFQIGDNQTAFTPNDPPVSLIPKQGGGNFQVLAGEQDISANVLEHESERSQFLPSAVNLGNADQLQLNIRYSITDDNGFSNQTQKRVTIFALPDASFQIGAQSNQTTFAINNPAVPLIPKLVGGSFRALIDRQDISAAVIDTTSNQSQFIPSAVNLGNTKQLPVTLEYIITDEQGLTNQAQQQVTIFALPDAGFQIGAQPNQTVFATNHPPVPLIANQAGGDFRILHGEQDITINTINTEVEPPEFIPSAVNLGNAKQQQVIIEYTFTDGYGFTNQVQQIVTIFAPPDAGFQIGEQPNQTAFAANHPPVSLIPNQPGGSFRILAGEQDISTDVLNTQSQPPQLIPSKVNLGNAEQREITIAYIITDANGLTNQTQQQVTILALPNANFQIGSVPNKTNFCANDGQLSLTPQQGGGSFRVLLGGQDISAAVLNTQSNPPELNLSAVNLGNAEQLQITVEYSITNDNGMTNNNANVLTVHRVPVANFQAEIASINAQGFSVRVFGIQPADTSFSYVWRHPGATRDESLPANQEFLINYTYDFDSWVVGDEVSITLRIETPAALGGCSSEPVNKRVAIPCGGVVSFNLLNSSNNQVINSISLGNERTFRLSDFNANNEYNIEAVTVPATVENIVFTYTNPTNEENVQPAGNNKIYKMPDGWYLVVGVHKLKAQVFREVNGRQVEGIAATVIIRIQDSNSLTAETPKPPETTTLLNRLRLIFPTGKEINLGKVGEQKSQGA
ncbi:hypothetical protein NIES37_49980 [Tolypothrix tenuis PCC 7101]|uniref:Uncharacterized protein n=1 Tax=Tolypothrix tenuis PCC 7101 TaxID=231146 RepID=A0A1Z4N5I6_9CYAN|nr:hypothetical protein [Aulosira sp. FACHB-113]BAZ01000.1 hypothetical protein NIES37_49980 [Tolypothrix tenuis PCC 7101]BAZ75077.1 hypothetical protein NIES50_36570 [Aulosira laxa NIES-50]